MTRAAPQKSTSAVVVPKSHSAARAFDTSRDPLEQEADCAAERALALPANAASAEGLRPVRPAAFPTSHVDAFPSSVSRTLGDPGAPLERGLRADMERRFGHDFSHVRIHADRAAAESALDVDAQAYTVGHHVVFGVGNFAPGTHDGRRLIAHELAHVIQQSPQGARGSARVLPRKPGPGGAGGGDAASKDHDADPVPAQPVAEPSMSDDAQVDASDVRDPLKPAPPAELPVSPPPMPRGQAQTNNLGPVPVPDAGVSAQAPPGGSATGTKQQDDSAMPSLTDLLAEREKQADVEPGGGLTAVEGEGAAHDTTSEPEEVDIGALLGTLAFGAGEARKAINDHSLAARSGIDRGAKRSSKNLEEQTKTADDAIRALARQRHTQLDKTILAHETEINWLEESRKETATTYSDNAKQAQKDGFAFYRSALAGVFVKWARKIEKLDKKQSDRLTRETDENARIARQMAELYDRRHIRSNSSQSEGRMAVQREAANEVAEEHAKEFEKTIPAVLPELSKASSGIIAELLKSRDEALVEYDKGLPLVLSGIDEQLRAAHLDITTKAREARGLLAKAAIEIRARVNLLEETALKRNSTFRTRVDGQIEDGRASAEQQFRRATPEAMEPIAAIVDEAVGILTNTDEELDPDGSRQFVDEVVDFSLQAADATGVVFAAAGDASVGTLAGAVPFAKRGFAAGKQDLAATLHSEGAENEFALIDFGTEVERYLNASLTTLDETFNAGVTEAGTRLTSLLNDTREQLREPMEKAEADLLKSVNDVLWRQADARRRLPKAIDNAARQAAWRYDHPVMRRVVRGVEIFLGVVAAIVILAALVITLPFIVGEAAALVIIAIAVAITAFLLGYNGAEAYEKRRQAGAGRASAFFGAVADVTGINDVRRAVTDQKMADFDRGFALGNFLLGLFSVGKGATRFVSAIKPRLPKVFTNPFRLKRSTIPDVPPANAPGISVPDTPKMGFELPHQKQPRPDAPKTPPVEKPDRIGFKLPHEERLPVDSPRTAGKPDSDAVSPILHHRKPAVPEATPPAPKRPIGLRPPEKTAPKSDAPSGTRDAPAPTTGATQSGGVISQLPPARQVPSAHRPGAGTPQAPVNRPANAVGSSTPETPRPTGEVPVAQPPTKGSVVSNVEAGIPSSSPSRNALSTAAEARLADERAVQSARERRVADEARVGKARKEFEEIENIKNELGPRRDRDYIDDAYDTRKAELKDAEADLRKSRRAEVEAEAAERIHLKRRRDLDPARAKHDPELRKEAHDELELRKKRFAENEALIKANESDLAAARAKVAERQKTFDEAPPGHRWNEDGRKLLAAKNKVRQQLDSAKRHLKSVEDRTVPARTANQKHVERMQDLDRVLHPEKYPELSADKGNFGEMKGHEDMASDDYQFRGSSKQPKVGKSREQGLDGVYEKPSAAAKEPKHVVGESKYDQSKLSPGQKKAEWVDDNLDTTVGREHANKMRAESYEYWVLKYDPKLMRVRRTKLWVWRPNGKYGPGGRPLGKAHLIPPS